MYNCIIEKRKLNVMTESSSAPSRDPRVQRQQTDVKLFQIPGSHLRAGATSTKNVTLVVRATENDKKKLQSHQELVQNFSRLKRNTLIVDCDISAGSILWCRDAPEKTGRYRFASIDERMFAEACNCIENEALMIEDTEVSTYWLCCF